MLIFTTIGAFMNFQENFQIRDVLKYLGTRRHVTKKQKINIPFYI